MKKIYYSIALLSLVVVSCKDDDRTTLSESATAVEVALENKVEGITLNSSMNDEPALNFSWKAFTPAVATPVGYRIVFENAAGEQTFTSVLSETERSIKASDLNAIAQQLGAKAGQSVQLKARVQAIVGANKILAQSEIFTINTNAYSLLIVPSQWGIVGGFTGWAAPDIPFWRVTGEDAQNRPGELVAYVTLPEGDDSSREFKFRKDSDWNGSDLGDKDTDGTLGKEDNINKNKKFGAGKYRIFFNPEALTYTMEAFSWGLVGSAVNDWGNTGPDTPLTYNGELDAWEAKNVTFTTGEFKIRLNNEWKNDKGGKDGKITGDNIPVEAGIYDFSISFTEGTYTLTKK